MQNVNIFLNWWKTLASTKSWRTNSFLVIFLQYVPLETSYFTARNIGRPVANAGYRIENKATRTRLSMIRLFEQILN